MSVSRRQFLGQSSVGLGLLATGAFSMESTTTLSARPYNLPTGLQLYTLRDQLPKDYEGTLKQVGDIGYREVELFGEQTKTAAELLKTMKAAKLTPVSAHYLVAEIQTGFEAKIAFAKELGLKYMVCAFPAFKDPARLPAGTDMFKAIVHDMTLDDWRWLADVFNKAGEQTKKAGIQFAYHNHNIEFRDYNGVLAYDELLKNTDPALVKMEMDCGWVVVAGHDPAAYMQKYPGRFPLLHIKDMKPGEATTTVLDPNRTTEVGSGTIDWKKVFAAAKTGGMQHYFVEQEAFAGSPLDGIKKSFDYLQKLK
jgi:sugar phosphate isomerase/epimerase